MERGQGKRVLSADTLPSNGLFSRREVSFQNAKCVTIGGYGNTAQG
jgi:hypothetical protein